MNRIRSYKPRSGLIPSRPRAPASGPVAREVGESYRDYKNRQKVESANLRQYLRGFILQRKGASST